MLPVEKQPSRNLQKPEGRRRTRRCDDDASDRASSSQVRVRMLTYPKRVMAHQPHGKLLTRVESMRCEGGSFFWFVEVIGLLEEVNALIFDL